MREITCSARPAPLHGPDGVKYAVDPVADVEAVGLGLEVDVARADLQRVVQRRVHEPDDRAGVLADGLEREVIDGRCRTALRPGRGSDRVHRPQPVLVAREVGGDIGRVRETPGEWHRQPLLRPAPKMGVRTDREKTRQVAPAGSRNSDALALQRFGERQQVERRNELVELVHGRGRVMQGQPDRFDELGRCAGRNAPPGPP